MFIFFFLGFCDLIKLCIMVKEIYVQGLEVYRKVVDENKGKIIFVLFFGFIDVDGKSWCFDCVIGKFDLKKVI